MGNEVNLHAHQQMDGLGKKYNQLSVKNLKFANKLMEPENITEA